MFYVAANELQYIAGMCYVSMGTALLLWKQYGVHYLILSVTAWGSCVVFVLSPWRLKSLLLWQQHGNVYYFRYSR